MKLKSFYSFLTKDLEVIENELLSSVQTKDPLIREAGIHLLQAGENGFALFLYCCQECSEIITLTV